METKRGARSAYAVLPQAVRQAAVIVEGEVAAVDGVDPGSSVEIRVTDVLKGSPGSRLAVDLEGRGGPAPGSRGIFVLDDQEPHHLLASPSVGRRDVLRARHDGFDEIQGGGYPSNVFEELGDFGGPPVPLDVTDDTTSAELWNVLHGAEVRGDPATVNIYGDKFPGLPDDSGHALTVIDTYEVDGEQMVKLRSPWGTNDTSYPGRVPFEQALTDAGAILPGEGVPDDGTFEIRLSDLDELVTTVNTA